MSLITATAACTAAFALTAAGCADGSAAGNGDSSTPTRNEALSPGPAQPATELVRVSGTVVSGAEPGCKLLDAGGAKYVLLGGDRAAIEEAEENEVEVTVTGQAHTPTPTTCTEGVPLAIQQFTPAT